MMSANNSLGQLAYETYFDPNIKANSLYPRWDQLYPEQQTGWQRAAEAVRDVPQGLPLSADQLAQLFHETYERLAPQFGYKTREASAKPWAEVPEQNKALMVAVASEVLKKLGNNHGA